MSRSSKSRRAKARGRKYATKHAALNNPGAAPDSSPIIFTETDKRYLIAFAVLSLIITAIYWNMGGRNLFVFPTLLCISVGARKYWSGPIRRFADPS